VSSAPDPMVEKTGVVHAGQAALSEALQLSFRLLRWIMLFLVLAYLFSGIFVVAQHEKAVVLVFGKVSGFDEERIKGPGLHWAWPRPFAEVVRVAAERVQKIETAAFWFFEPPLPPGAPDGQRPPTPAAMSMNPERDGYTLTADANLLHTRWALRYTVSEPEAYLFRFHDIRSLIIRELDHAVVRASARTAIDRALRTDIEGVRAEVESSVRQRCDRLGLGIKVQGIDFLNQAPPLQVAAAFDNVAIAASVRGKSILDANSYAETTRNEARGAASRILAEGQAAKEGILSSVKADADFFEKVRGKYARHPKELARRQLEDTLRRVLSATDETDVIPSNLKEIRLLISPTQENLLEASE
jgi:membrane protease subunit HflK